MPCCDGSACAYDFGDGCGEELWIPEGTKLPEPSACASGDATLGLVYEGIVHDVAMGPDALYLDKYGTSERIVEISKATCQMSEAFTGSVDEFAVDSKGTLYVADDDTASPFLSRLPPDGSANPIILDAVLGREDVRVSFFVPGEESAWALLEYDLVDNGRLQTTRALVEVPCCEGGARIVENPFVAPPDLKPPVEGQVVGSTLYFTHSEVVLDIGPFSSTFTYDPASGESSVLLDSHQGDPPFGYDEHRSYFQLDQALVALEPDSCRTDTLVARPRAERISATTLAGSELFWAEAYRGLGIQRIYHQAPGGEPSFVASTSPRHPPVEWIGVDETHVYWATRDRIERAARP